MSNPELPTPCQWASSQLLELREKVLGPADEARLHAHLAGCPLCRQEIAWDERLTRQLRAAPVSRVPSNIAARVHRRLWRHRLLRAGMAAAAVLLIVSFLWSRWPRLPDRPGAGRVENPPPSVTDIPGSNVLFAAPPVDALDVLARQQSAYLSALREPKEQDR